MFGFYFITICIWAAILTILYGVLNEDINKNGWNIHLSFKGGTLAFFVISFVPLFRLCVAYALVVAASNTKEELEEKQKRRKKGD